MLVMIFFSLQTDYFNLYVDLNGCGSQRILLRFEWELLTVNQKYFSTFFQDLNETYRKEENLTMTARHRLTLSK